MKMNVYSPTIRRKEMDAVLSALVEDKVGPGEHSKFLIQTAKEKIKFDYCLALRSPVIALYLALNSLNLKKGQGVLISALSPLYYARVIEDSGLVPVYCDVFPSTACVSRETIDKAVSSRPDGLEILCIVIHHTLGYIPGGAAIAELGIPVIEDCSQSYGTFIGTESESGFSDKKPVEGIGVFTILGLEERDMLTSGGGALLYSMNRRDASVLRNLGDLPPEYGLPDMNAAMAVVQFREAPKNLLKRREIARLYTQSALRTRHKMFVQPDGVEYNNYAFPLVLESGMKDVKAYAKKKEIAVENAFENTLISMVKPELSEGPGTAEPLARGSLGEVSRVQCPEASSLFLRTVLFPIYPRLGMADAGKVAKLILTLP